MKTKHESKILPGVVFTLRRLTEGARIRMVETLADALEDIEDMQRKAAELRDEVAPLLASLETLSREEQERMIRREPQLQAVLRLQSRIELKDETAIMPAYVRALCAGIEENGKPIVNHLHWLFEEAPREFYAEVLAAVRGMMPLTVAEQGNSESPSTSTAAVDGETNPTAAEPVNGVATVA